MEHPFLELLRQGPAAWNSWRHDNADVLPRFDAAELVGWALDGANLDDAMLFEANLANASLVGASLRRAVLQGADLRGANLRSADLSDADLSGTWDRDPTARLAWPTGADLRGASLHRALFARTGLRGCEFSGARLDRTIFADVNLSLAQGLEDAIHDGPSEITVSTVAKSRGVLSRAFFVDCGVPEVVLQSVLVPKPGAAPDQYESCFISHSSQDKEFAEQLAERLTNEGVSVWYDNRNVRGGRPLADQFRDAIQASDRLVLVVSEHSLASEWVAYEVGEATRRQHEISDRVDLRRSLLFPIRLLPMEELESILEAGSTDNRLQVIDSYHLSDFTQWRDQERFDDACNRMILDLRKDE
jgi:uncharacterized protein YjbI with pentapeptide repeats